MILRSGEVRACQTAPGRPGWGDASDEPADQEPAGQLGNSDRGDLRSSGPIRANMTAPQPRSLSNQPAAPPGAPTPADIAALLPRLRRFACSLCGNRSDADDLVQAACEKALTRLHQFQPGTRFDSWMLRIVQTSFIDGLRARRRAGPQADPARLVRLSDDGVAARRGDARLLLSAVRRAVADLPAEQRAVLALVAIEGYSYKEVATILEAPVGTVMSRLSRARARLLPLSSEAA